MAGLLTLSAASAAAAPVAVEGDVIATQSRWTSDGSRIVTDATVRTPGGDIVVSQLGGRADGYGMRVFHGEEPLEVGMRVAVGGHRALDLSMREHVVVDRVRVLAWPPGFVRTGPTKAGKYLFWESGCVFVTVDAAGTKQVAGDAEFGVVSAAIAEWNGKVGGCSFMNLVEEERAEVEVGRDNRNVIKFRDASWCRPAVGDDPARCYSSNAAGLTTAVFVDDESSDRDGAIVDADVELNGEHFAIAVAGESEGTMSCLSEIGNTLTHELGHLLGLEHPCRTGGDPPRVDDEGNEVPQCGATNDPDITEATMFNFQDCGETSKASLAPDDIDAICSIYPTADDPGECKPVGEESGCSTSDGGHPAGPLALAGVMFFALRRKRAYR